MLANTLLLYHKIIRNSKFTVAYLVTFKRVRILLSHPDENGLNWSKLVHFQVKLIHRLIFFSPAMPVEKNSPVKWLAGEEIYSLSMGERREGRLAWQPCSSSSSTMASNPSLDSPGDNGNAAELSNI